MGEKHDLVKLDKIPDWVNQDNIDYLRKPDFQLIVRFFVINTPDKNTSARAKEIIDYGINNEIKLFNELKGEMPMGALHRCCRVRADSGAQYQYRGAG